MRALETNPRPPGAVLLAAQSGNRVWRIRVGEYRVLYEIQDDRLVVMVIRFGHRREVYRSRK
jgi:mRNA interferase RelE/StbE